MPEGERDADCSTGVAGRGLNPDLIEDLFAQEPAVADAVERHAAGQTEIAHAGFALREPRHPDHHFFGDFLHRPVGS